MSGEKKEFKPEINAVESLSKKLIELNLEFDEKNRQLEQSEKARKLMFTNISHDLRAPISAIRGACYRLIDPTIDHEEVSKLAKIIDSRSSVLERLIDDLYFSVMIDQPEFNIELNTLEIAPILEEYYISMRGSGKFKKKFFGLTIPEGFDARVNLDPQYFLRVLDNLISNAVRYTSDGDTIEIACEEKSGFVEIVISDTGIGIAKEDIPYIFDRTYTVLNARTPGESGSGLGLAIAKTIVEKHTGTIRCESTLKKGTAFYISFPCVN